MTQQRSNSYAGRKDKNIIKGIVAQNKEVFERLANEEPAKERRKNKVVRKVKKILQKMVCERKRSRNHRSIVNYSKSSFTLSRNCFASLMRLSASFLLNSIFMS